MEADWASPVRNRLLTTPEAAEFLNVPVRWLEDAVRQRRVRCTRIGKHIRFTSEHLAELVESGEQTVIAPTSGVPKRRSRL